VERSIYEGLSLNQMNSSMQTHAVSLWLPVYEHSNDFRSELMIFKRFPFQVIVKLENMSNELIARENMQTYIEIDSKQQISNSGCRREQPLSGWQSN